MLRILSTIIGKALVIVGTIGILYMIVDVSGSKISDVRVGGNMLYAADGVTAYPKNLEN